MFKVYVLVSLKDGHFYTGISNNVAKRVKDHNGGRVRSTKPRRPFELVYQEIQPSRVAARLREKYFKSGCGREYLKSLVSERFGKWPNG